MKITSKQLNYVLTKIIEGECLLCKIDINEEMGNKGWDLPLCKKHRIEYLDREAKKLLKHDT